MWDGQGIGFEEVVYALTIFLYVLSMEKDQVKNKVFPSKNTPQLWFILALVVALGVFLYYSRVNNAVVISEKRFEQMMLNQDVRKVTLITNQLLVEVSIKLDAFKKEEYRKDLESHPYLSHNPNNIVYLLRIPTIEIFDRNFKNIEAQLPEGERIGYLAEERSGPPVSFRSWSLFSSLFLLYWFFGRRTENGITGTGSNIFNINKLRANVFDQQTQSKITFKDVAGMKEAKEEVKEIVDFLKTPGKFTTIGGKIPRGILLVGPPGTGKTLLARAVAGESNVPFIFLSGSDFVEMFVGVGAARVRELFRKAKEKAPCIIFIDEIDAIGRSRGKANMPGVNDERENTLNSLLVEMDGFATNSGVIIMAATNRPEVLDAALLRPGRFDRQVSIDNPDIVDREAIIQYYCNSIKLGEGINIKQLAEQTPGFSGADLSNMCNEAALMAARGNKPSVSMDDFQAAIDRIVGGLEKKNKVISAHERKIVAYHEAGHAIAGWFLEHAHPVVKVSIVPRGVAALGYTQYLPKEQFLYQKDQLLDEIAMALGGRASEEIKFGQVSTGAVNDLERVTQMAYGMISVYGMNEKIGNLSFHNSKQSDYTFTKPYSDQVAYKIDEEARMIIEQAYARVKALLLKYQDKVELLAETLLTKETIFTADLEALIGEPKRKPKEL